jgi:AraC family transcriptional regulator, arabinose operon regulatory protein
MRYPSSRHAEDILAAFETIRFHTPAALDAVFPYHVVAAGRTRARPDAPPVVRRYNQHVLILTLDGCGQVEVNGRLRAAAPGSVVWLNTTHDYAHRCDHGAADWRYVWLGMQGFGLDQMFAAVSHCALEPATRLTSPQALADLFAAIIARMETRPPNQSAANSADVAHILAAILEDRRLQVSALPGGPLSPVDRVVLSLREALARAWRIEDMARLAGLSASQLHRLFRKDLGISPMQWLRIERMNAAKPLLVARQGNIARVAEAVGYDDPYHFSRDFRTVTGRSPSDFRRAGGA